MSRPEELWTKRQTAAYFAIHPRTLDRWVKEDIIPIGARVVIGGSVRFRSEVIRSTFSIGEAM